MKQISFWLAIAQAVCLLVLFPLILNAREVNFVKKPLVTDVLVGIELNKTRITIEISKPTNIRYILSPDNSAIFVVFPNVEWTAQPFEPRHSKGQIIEFRYSPHAGGGTFSILTDQPVSITEPILEKATTKNGYKIIIELTAKNDPVNNRVTQNTPKLNQ